MSSRSTAMEASGTRETTHARPHTCFWFKPRMFRWSTWSLSGLRREIHGASARYPGRDLNTTHIPSAWHGSPCARPTKACSKGEQWCKRCIWGNLLPEWKRAFGSVESIHSGDFIDLWTGRIDHLANRYGAADSGCGCKSQSQNSHSTPSDDGSR